MRVPSSEGQCQFGAIIRHNKMRHHTLCQAGHFGFKQPCLRAGNQAGPDAVFGGYVLSSLAMCSTCCVCRFASSRDVARHRRGPVALNSSQSAEWELPILCLGACTPVVLDCFVDLGLIYGTHCLTNGTPELTYGTHPMAIRTALGNLYVGGADMDTVLSCRLLPSRCRAVSIFPQITRQNVHALCCASLQMRST